MTRSAQPASAWLLQGPFSEPGSEGLLAQAIVTAYGPDPRRLAAAVQGLMVHIFWRKAYGCGLELENERAEVETNLRRLADKLGRIRTNLEAEGAMGPAWTASQGRPPALPLPRRLIGNCRDFSLMYAALLRLAGIPARARCGFATYFQPDHGEDHWVVERWDGARWAISDAQLDPLMLERLDLGRRLPGFDPMDLPAGAFLSGGEAWLACRGGGDPARYGIFDLSGWDFVLGDFVRDVASLAGKELLPWDMWGIMLKGYANLDDSDLAMLDAAARATAMTTELPRKDLEALGAGPAFAVPRTIQSFRQGRLVEVALGEDA